MISYDNKVIEFNGCPGCAYANHEFSLSCGMVYEDADVTMSQDWELPIPGFFVISPNKHASRISEIDEDVKLKMNQLASETIKILEEHDICEGYNLISEEKPGRHYHIWLMPRHKWMRDKFDNIMTNIGPIFEYAKTNLRTEETYTNIIYLTNLVKNELELKYDGLSLKKKS